MTSCGSGEREGSGDLVKPTHDDLMWEGGERGLRDLVKPTHDDLMWVGGERGFRGPGQTYT